MTQKIRKAPKGAKPTNPKYTLTLTKPAKTSQHRTA